MNRGLASEWCARELAAAVGDHLIHVHIELCAAARHPYVQREHVMMLAGEDFVTNLRGQFVLQITEPLAVMIGRGCGLFQNGIGSDHFTRNQILADTEMLERTLSLSTPELIRRHFNHA